jgi:GNAT superfamily N-acetyltransferase
MSNLTLRDARPSERAAITELTLAAYQEYAAPMGPHWENYRENIVTTLADVTPASQLVAEQDGALVGTVLVYPRGTVFSDEENSFTLPAPEVRLLAVAPEARGQGIGKALMQECIRRARAAREPVLSLHTTDLMQSAMQMYERMGFVRTPETDFHPAPHLVIKGYQFNLMETD